MRYKTSCTVHVCDGCSTSVIQLDLENLPDGQYLDVMSVGGDQVRHGAIFTCKPSCIIPAYANLQRKWEQDDK